MKKLVIALLLLAATQASFAQNAGDIFAMFKNKPGAEYVHVPKLMLNVARKFVDKKQDKDALQIIKHIDSVRVLDLEDSSDKVKAAFLAETKNFNTKGYEELLRTVEDGTRTLILIKSKNNVINELLILEAGNEDCELVQIKGEITQAEIDRLVAEHQKSNKQ
ncbi:MAG TPA: DUF4252 domain-containing protein [Prevotella sp.]